MTTEKTPFEEIPDTAQVEEMFLDFDQLLVYDGKIWKYKPYTRHKSVAVRFDKYVHEKIKTHVKSLRPFSSILTGRSIKELVEPHAKNRFLFQCDISKYFESISFEPVINESLIKSDFDSGLLDKIERFYFDEDKNLRRGLRASAVLSEIMGAKIDGLVKRLLFSEKLEYVTYTRYYDDLLFSANDKQPLRIIEKLIDDVLAEIDLKIKKNKSRLILVESSKILGLRVHEGMITVPRKFKRIARARAHNFDKEFNAMVPSDWEDANTIYDMKRQVGSVVGSYWYLVNNSSSGTAFEEAQITKYMEILYELDDGLAKLHNDIDIFYHEQ